MRPKVFLTKEVPSQVMELIQHSCDVAVWSGSGTPSKADMLAAVREVAGIYVTMGLEQVDAEIMDQAPGLRVISNNGVGCNHVDLEAATERGIYVANTPGANSAAVADHAIGFIIALAHRFPFFQQVVKSGAWKSWALMEMLGSEVHHRTLGLAGMGHIAQEVAKRARAFDMTVVYHSRTRRPELEDRLGIQFVDVDTLFRVSDFLSLHMPANADTYHFVNRSRLAMMKDGAILVNTARGGLVDQDALCEELAGGRLGGAGLDVTDPEPLPANHLLLGLENCIITPHRAGATYDTRIRQAMMAGENLVTGALGKPVMTVANPEVLTKLGVG